MSQIKIPSGALPERPCYKTWRDDFRLLALISALGLKSGKDVIADEEKNGAVFDQAKPGLHEEMRAWYDTMRHKLAAEYNSLSSDQACMWRQWNRDMWKAVTAVRQKVPDLDDDDGTRSEERRVLVAANFVVRYSLIASGSKVQKLTHGLPACPRVCHSGTASSCLV